MAETQHRNGGTSGGRKSALERKPADFTEQARTQFDKVASQVEDAATATLERGREMGEQVHAVGKNARSAVDQSLKHHPMTTLAMAAAMGFLLGALWKS